MRRGITLIALLLAACSSASSGPPSLELSEFAIDAGGVWAAGPTTIPIENKGEFGHTVIVTDPSGEVIAATDVLEPGQGYELDVDLNPGRYEFTCRIVVETPNGEISDHYEEGMVTSVHVPG